MGMHENYFESAVQRVPEFILGERQEVVNYHAQSHGEPVAFKGPDILSHDASAADFEYTFPSAVCMTI